MKRLLRAFRMWRNARRKRRPMARFNRVLGVPKRDERNWSLNYMETYRNG